MKAFNYILLFIFMMLSFGEESTSQRQTKSAPIVADPSTGKGALDTARVVLDSAYLQLASFRQELKKLQSCNDELAQIKAEARKWRLVAKGYEAEIAYLKENPVIIHDTDTIKEYYAVTPAHFEYVPNRQPSKGDALKYVFLGRKIPASKFFDSTYLPADTAFDRVEELN